MIEQVVTEGDQVVADFGKKPLSDATAANWLKSNWPEIRRALEGKSE